MKIWICIPVFNRVSFTLKCLEKLKQQSFDNYRIVVCDHGSTDGTTGKINEQFPDVTVLPASSDLWWTGAINRCVEYVLENAADDDYLLTLNNDTELPVDYLQQLASKAVKYRGAVITSVIHDIKTQKLVSPGYRLNWLTAKSTPVDFATDHLEGDKSTVAVTHASGRGTLFPIQVFRRVGLFDEQRLPHYGADYDLSHKALKAGFPIYVGRDCIVYSYVEENGLTSIKQKKPFKGFIEYLFGRRSPANLKVRWWYGWNNCPKRVLPFYLLFDFVRTVGSFFRSSLLMEERASNG